MPEFLVERALPRRPERAEPNRLARPAVAAARRDRQLRPEEVLALQVSAGNQAVTGLLRAAARATIAREAAPSSADADDFNPESIVNDLRRAIDQSDTKPVPKKTPGGSAGLTMGSLEFDLVRNVETDAVVRALENKTAKQIERIDQVYQAREGRSLAKDLFEDGESGHPSDLKPDEVARIKALMKGTVPEPQPPGTSEAGAPQTPEGRLEADAIELHQLAEKDLDNEARRERVMTLHRRPVQEINAIDAIYTKQYGHGPLQDLVGQLNDLQRTRLLMLRVGAHAKADALAIEEKRIALDELAEKAKESPFEAIKAKAERKELIAGIESIVDLNRREAMADPANADKSADQAVKDRLSQVLGESSAEPGKDLGAALAKTLGPVEGGAIAAMLNGSLVETAARRLLEMEEHDTTSTPKLSELLREFRPQAEHDVMARVYDPWVPASDKQALLDKAKFKAAVDEQATRYTKSFAETYDRIRGDRRSYAEIIAGADEYNQDLLNALTAQGGRLTPYQELDHAIRDNEPKDVAAVLKKQPDGKAVKALVDEWQQKHPGKDLHQLLFGLYGPGVAEKDIPKRYTGALLSGRDAASAVEALDKPTQLGGADEVEWIERHGRKEVDVTEANSGVMGSLRELGDDPETQVLMNESGQRLKALKEEWERNDPHGRPRDVILKEMRRVRATLTGDATAYEEENERMVAELRSAVSFAVQIALAVALPGVGTSFLATTALQIGATVASNMIIYGEQYSLTMFRNDLIGGGLGALGGKLGEEVVGAVAKEVAGSSAKAVTEAAERAGVSTALAKEAGMAAAAAKEASIVTRVAKEGANMVGSTAGTSVGTGENGFTLEGMAQNLFFMGVGKLRGGHEVVVEYGPAPEHAPAAPVPERAASTGEHAPSPREPIEVESKAPSAAADEPTVVEKQPRSGEEPTVVDETSPFADDPTLVEHRTLGPDEPTFVDDIADQMPDETVMQPADARDAASAREMYENSAADRTREAAIYRNTETGEYIVIQGDEGMVSVGGRQEPRKGGYAQRWKEILNAGSDVGRWELQAHSHPSGKGGVVDPVNMWPSGANADIGAMVAESRSSGEPRSSRIDYVTADGPSHTEFGFDPTHEKPIWVDLPDGRGGRRTKRFKTMESYHDFMENTMGAPQGDIPEHMSGTAPTEPAAGAPESMAPEAARGGPRKPPGPGPSQPTTADVQRRIDGLRARYSEGAANRRSLAQQLRHLERMAVTDPATVASVLDRFETMAAHGGTASAFEEAGRWATDEQKLMSHEGGAEPALSEHDRPNQPVDEVSASRALADAMEAATGEPRPPDSDAHHIVAWDDPRAEIAREIIRGAGIDPTHDPRNGVYLPARAGRDAAQTFERHPTIHHDGYYQELTLRLIEAKYNGTVEQTLAQIQHEISRGEFTFRRGDNRARGETFLAWFETHRTDIPLTPAELAAVQDALEARASALAERARRRARRRRR